MARPPQNVTFAARCTFRGDELGCFDKLPAALRRALHEGVIKWSALEARWMLNKRIKAGMSQVDAVAVEVAQIRASDAAEVNEFAHHWPARFGRLTPHVRAQATIMRYDEAARHRRRCAT